MFKKEFVILNSKNNDLMKQNQYFESKLNQQSTHFEKYYIRKKLSYTGKDETIIRFKK